MCRVLGCGLVLFVGVVIFYTAFLTGVCLSRILRLAAEAGTRTSLGIAVDYCFEDLLPVRYY